MNAHRILADLSERGVRIWTEAGRLEIDDVSGFLTDDDVANLAAHKSELMAALAQQRGTNVLCYEPSKPSKLGFDGSPLSDSQTKKPTRIGPRFHYPASVRLVEERLTANLCPQCGGWMLADHPETGAWCGGCRYNWLPLELEQMRATFARWRDVLHVETERRAA